jgi:hypothetical protein
MQIIEQLGMVLHNVIFRNGVLRRRIIPVENGLPCQLGESAAATDKIRVKIKKTWTLLGSFVEVLDPQQLRRGLGLCCFL